MKNIRVKEERLWQSLMDMAKIGALPNGGCRRLALTDEDKEAVSYTHLTLPTILRV